MLIEREFPAAMALAEDADATLAHLRLPAAHRKDERTTDENVKALSAQGGERVVRWSGRG